MKTTKKFGGSENLIEVVIDKDINELKLKYLISLKLNALWAFITLSTVALIVFAIVYK